MSGPRRCDVCADAGAAPVTAAERAGWWFLAPWIAHVCSACRARFERSARRHGSAAA